MLQPTEIEWLDAAEHSYDGAPSGAPGMIVLRTIGYYCKRTRKEIHLATDLDPLTGDVRTTHVIPRIHIKRFSLLATEPGQHI